MSKENGRLVKVRNLKKYFPITRGIILQRHVGDIKAVDDVSFDIYRGETLGLVGETGCGKTTLGRTVLWLYKPTAGKIFFDDVDLVHVKGADLRQTRRRADSLPIIAVDRAPGPY